MSATIATSGPAKCSMKVGPGGSPQPSKSIFTLALALTAARSITISASVIRSASTDCLEDQLVSHHDLVVLGKVFAVAFAVGLDVLAISVGIGITRLALGSRLRVGFTFAGSEIAMQVIGYELGAGAGHILGDVAAYAGFALLALIGFVMIRKSLQHSCEAKFDATRGAGLLITSLSISLDSLAATVFRNRA